MSTDVLVRVSMEGEAEVSEGFRRLGRSAEDSSRQMRSFGREVASIGASISAVGRLGEMFGVLSKEEANVIREMGNMMALFGTVARGLSYLQNASWAVTLAEKARGAAHQFADAMAAGAGKVASVFVSALAAIKASSIATAVAEKARAVAHAIANAVSSMGVLVPVLVAAASAAAVGIAAAFGAVPMAKGGVVTKPTLALIGEREPEIVLPLSKVSNVVNVAGSPFDSSFTVAFNAAPKAQSELPVAKSGVSAVSAGSSIIQGGGSLSQGSSLLQGVFLSEGGVVLRPTLALVGEREPEAVVPLSKIFNFTS
ncbi:hypothetical protein G4O51_11870, partial [Candidatus Bathyarchaeota archaeon A05DMB-2]|nr:hypothetical protein [Candidatus Bathyarchaeota archaeon A05DMB-2]